MLVELSPSKKQKTTPPLANLITFGRIVQLQWWFKIQAFHLKVVYFFIAWPAFGSTLVSLKQRVGFVKLVYMKSPTGSTSDSVLPDWVVFVWGDLLLPAPTIYRCISHLKNNSTRKEILSINCSVFEVIKSMMRVVFCSPIDFHHRPDSFLKLILLILDLLRWRASSHMPRWF